MFLITLVDFFLKAKGKECIYSLPLSCFLTDLGIMTGSFLISRKLTAPDGINYPNLLIKEGPAELQLCRAFTPEQSQKWQPVLNSETWLLPF